MQKRTRWICLLLVSNALTLAALAYVTAAPIVPKRKTIAPDMQSLANITQLSITIDNMPQALHDAGITSERIENAWRERLTKAGIEIVPKVEGSEVPNLRLRAEYLSDPAMPDTSGVLAFLTLNQNVHVTRIDRHIVLPSYTQYTVGMDKKPKLGEVFGPEIENMVNQFKDGIREATAYFKEAEAE